MGTGLAPGRGPALDVAGCGCGIGCLPLAIVADGAALDPAEG
jgi:hypothetical protein